MIEKTSTRRVLEWFFVHPTTQVHLRELSRQLKLSLPTIMGATKALEKEGLIKINKTVPLTLVRANNDKTLFIHLKRVHNLEAIYCSGMLEAIMGHARLAHTYVLFGSYSKGTDTERSDIDIAVIGAKAFRFDTHEFEKTLGRTVSLHASIKTPSGEFGENLKNGIVLIGSL